MHLIEPKLKKIGFLAIVLIAIFLIIGCKTYLNSTEQLDVETVQIQMQNEKIEPFEKKPTCDELSSVNNNVGTVQERLNKLEKLDCRINTIINNYYNYPKELIDMLSRDIDMLDFVLKYPHMKGNAGSDNIGKVTKGNIPLLIQWDERWGYSNYVDNIIAVNGCGPTALSMVIAGLTGNNSITPQQIANFSTNHGYYVKSVGTSWNLMTGISGHFGIKSKQLSLNQNAIFSSLKNGNPIICSVKAGDFTTKSHIIVLAGIENGKIKVHDPNSKKRSNILWDYDRIAPQIRNLWVFSVK